MEHVYYTVDPHEKDSALLKIIEAENPESAIIFCNTRRDTAYIHQYLSARGLRIGLISGEVGQKERQQVIKDLKDGTVRFLVATDVAARGIDINNLSHVFMYDHPIDSEVYVHRSGRTARAGNSGQAISLVGLVEEMNLKATATKFGMPLIKKTLPDEKKLQAIISERASVYLEQAYRNLKQTEKNGAKRMIPLLEDLIKSDDEKAVLGMILHQFYWKAFTGNEGAERVDASAPQEADLGEPDAAQ
jgi:ATP-dependent RNA helicase DeaD